MTPENEKALKALFKTLSTYAVYCPLANKSTRAVCGQCVLCDEYGHEVVEVPCVNFWVVQNVANGGAVIVHSKRFAVALANMAQTFDDDSYAIYLVEHYGSGEWYYGKTPVN